MKNMALNRPWKGHLFTASEWKQEGRVLPCSTSVGNVWAQIFLTLCTCPPKTTKWPQWILTLGLQRNFGKWANNEDGLYFSISPSKSSCWPRPPLLRALGGWRTRAAGLSILWLLAEFSQWKAQQETGRLEESEGGVAALALSLPGCQDWALP